LKCLKLTEIRIFESSVHSKKKESINTRDRWLKLAQRVVENSCLKNMPGPVANELVEYFIN
jgi:hypothetical protein